MLRLVLVLTCFLARPALAADRVEMWSGGFMGFGLTAEFSRDTEQTGVGRHIQESSMAGVAWRYGGLKIGAVAGMLGYDFTGAGAAQLRVVSFSAGHELAQVLGGTLSLELRHSRMWGPDTNLDVTDARIGWSLKF